MLYGFPDGYPLPMTRTEAQVLGALRTLVGASLVVAPAFAGRVWVGEHAQGPGTRVFARAIGARDVALGLRTLQIARAGRMPREQVVLGAASDVMDMVATLIAVRQLTPARRVAMPAIAGAVAMAGGLVARSAEGSLRIPRLRSRAT